MMWCFNGSGGDYIPIMLKDGKACDICSEYRNELNEWIKRRMAESEDK